MRFTHHEIRDRLDKFFGLKNAGYPDGIVRALEVFVQLTPNDRKMTLEACGAFFCTHCGGDDPNCHCWNDE